MLQHPAMNYVKQMFASDLVTDFLHLIHPQVLKRVLKLTYSEHFLNHFLEIIVFTKRLFLLPRQHWLLFEGLKTYYLFYTFILKNKTYLIFLDLTYLIFYRNLSFCSENGSRQSLRVSVKWSKLGWQKIPNEFVCGNWLCQVFLALEVFQSISLIKVEVLYIFKYMVWILISMLINIELVMSR